MLIKGVLEEQFISTKIKGVPTSNISVYLVVGKKSRHLYDNRINISITLGISEEEKSLKKNGFNEDDFYYEDHEKVKKKDDKM
jgi:hypothetical protein